MPYGLTTDGFRAKTLAEIRADLVADFQSKFGTGINTQPETPLGQIIDIMAERISLLWDLGEAIYNSVNPDAAQGTAQDNIASYVGVTRLQAEYSTVTVTLTGTPAAVVPAGTQFKVVGDDTAIFEMSGDATVGGGGTVDTPCQAVSTGAITAPAHSLTEIVTPVSGLTSVDNAADAVVGRAVETDAELRIRRLEELNKSGSATLEAIRNAILAVDNVKRCAGFENVSSVVDGYGRPPKSFEMYVQNGASSDIALAISENKPAGIETYGTETESVTDAEGQIRTIKFSRPVEIPLFVIVNITKETGSTINANDVKAAVMAYGETLNMGDDVLPNSHILPFITDEDSDTYVANIRDIEILVDVVNPPVTSTPIDIDNNELATIDIGDITVNIA